MSRFDVTVVLVLAVCTVAIGCPSLQSARTPSRGNTCRNNMRGVATALVDYELRAGNYPGYMNALELSDGKLYVDPQTGKPTPVSWVVMILPGLDRQATYNQWKMPTETVRTNQFIQPKVYIDQLLCPSDPQASKTGTPISFVVNTGLPDAPSAVLNSQAPEQSIPRDWAANGMFVENYFEHPLVRTDEATRGPMVLMTEEQVHDLKSRTILLTENIDATNYTFEPTAIELGSCLEENAYEFDANSPWTVAESAVGSIWKLGDFETTGGAPVMKPPVDSLQINHDIGGGDGKSFDHARPSSRHPGAVNVAFVEVSTMPLSDKISYFVYVKLMTSDDANVAPAGKRRDAATVDAIDPHRHLRDYRLTQADADP